MQHVRELALDDQQAFIEDGGYFLFAFFETIVNHEHQSLTAGEAAPVNLRCGVLTECSERSFDTADQRYRIALAASARAPDMQHELARVVPSVTHRHVRPTTHGTAHERNEICGDGIGVGFGGIAARTGNVAYQSI